MRPIENSLLNHRAPSGPVVIEFGTMPPGQNGPGGSSRKMVTGPPPGPQLELIRKVPERSIERIPLGASHVALSVDGTLSATSAAPQNEDRVPMSVFCVIVV